MWNNNSSTTANKSHYKRKLKPTAKSLVPIRWSSKSHEVLFTTTTRYLQMDDNSEEKLFGFADIESFVILLSFTPIEYERPKDLKKFLKLSLNLWTVLLKTIQNPSYEPKLLYYQLIVSIVNRPEFSLNYLKHCKKKKLLTSFRNSLLVLGGSSTSSSSHHHHHQPIQISSVNIEKEVEVYKNLLFQTVTHVIKVTKKEEHEFITQQVLAQLFAIAFFRLPGQIQVVMVDVIRTFISSGAATQHSSVCNSRAKEVERRVLASLALATDNTQQRCDNDEDTFRDNNPSLFQWCWVQTSNDTKEQCLLPQDQVLQKWFATQVQDLVFVNEFLQAISDHVRSVVVKERVRWETLPGYRHFLGLYGPLLNSAFYWSSVLAISQYSEANNDDLSSDKYSRYPTVLSPSYCNALFESSIHLLSDDSRLLCVWLQIAFENTSMHEPAVVKLCLNKVSRWLKVVPSTSCEDTITLLSVIKSLLTQSFHFEVLNAALGFIYEFYERLDTTISTILLSPNVFQKLFVHWSDEVRFSFHLILVYKLLQDTKTTDTVEACIHATTQQLPPSQKVYLKPALELHHLLLSRRRQQSSSSSPPRDTTVDPELLAKTR